MISMINNTYHTYRKVYMFDKKTIKIYGTGKVGEKGQIVIPVKARDLFNIKSGDDFIFFGHDKIIHLVKTDELNTLLNQMTKKFTSHISEIKKEIKNNSK
jgi:AbrB family looped-hinge helix DNA binding protein